MKSLDEIYNSIQEKLKSKKEDRMILEKELTDKAAKQQEWLESNRKAAYATKKIRTELPQDFFISGSSINSLLTYKSGNYRFLDLQKFTNEKINNISEITRNNDDLYLSVNFDLFYGNNKVIKLSSCYFINGFFMFNKFEINDLPISKIHGFRYYRGYIFANNRPNSIYDYHTTIRINANDISDIKILEVPNEVQWQGQPTDIVGYKGELYTIIAKLGNPSYFIKIDMELTQYSLVFLCGNVSSRRRINRQSPFIIHKDEVYIPTLNNATQPFASNSIGMTVYGMTGSIKREVDSIMISSGISAIDSYSRPYPHWMQIFNNKLILSNSAGIHRWIARFDMTTLALEEQYDTTLAITDDNSLMSDGYMYLNGELGNDIKNSKLLKIKYNDFTDRTVEIDNYNDGYGSYGSIDYNHYLDI